MARVVRALGARVCLGKCYQAPARASDTHRPPVRILAREAVVARNLGDNAAPALETYRARGGYRALDVALRRTPEEVVGVVEASELRGRGGAAFPTGRKWRAVLSAEPASRSISTSRSAAAILLNNFLSDIPAVGLADDSVDPELVERPERWNIRWIGRFMVEFGILSSIFDILTFAVLLGVFRAAPDLFRTACSSNPC